MTKSPQKAESWDGTALLLETCLRLNHHTKPTETQRDFLRLVGAALVDGLPLDEALGQSKPPEKLPGKQSMAYQLAKKNRDRRIKQAFDLLTSSHWSRCSKIATDLGKVRYALDQGGTLPDDRYTAFLVMAVQTGVKIVTTAKGIHDILKN